jgi:molybdopterin converting factor small subunit
VVPAADSHRIGAMALVRLRGPLKKLAGGASEHSVPGATVGELLCELEAAQPGLSGWILDERGRIRRHINVFVDGEYGREETPVGPDCRVDVLPAISGG